MFFKNNVAIEDQNVSSNTTEKSTTAPGTPEELTENTPAGANIQTSAANGEREPAIDPQKEGLSDFEKKPLAKRVIVLFALCLALFMAALDISIITTAASTISEEFHTSTGYAWIGSAFLLATAATLSTWGKISDVFGRKPILLIVNIIFFVGSLVCALANSLTMLLAGRAVQGLGAGGLTVLVNICIADLFSLRTRPKYYSIIGCVWAVASALGPVIGGAFTEKVSWRWCFYINLPLDGLAFIIILFFLDIKTPKTPFIKGILAIDWTGAILISGATLMFLFGLEFGGVNYPWKSAIVICLLIFGVVAYVLFVLNEKYFAKYPILPHSVYSNFSRTACLLTTFFQGVILSGSYYYLPLYFQTSLGKTPIVSGLLLLPSCLALSLTSIATGIYMSKTGRCSESLYFGFFFMTLGNGLYINLDANSSLAKIIIYQIFVGLGIGTIFQGAMIALQSQLKARDAAAATSTVQLSRTIGTCSSVVIGGVIYQNQIATHLTSLTSSIGRDNAVAVVNSGVGRSSLVVNELPVGAFRHAAQVAVADSLKTMWIFYTVIAAVGLLTTFMVKSKTLTFDHQETKTGLDVERENARQRKAEMEEKRQRALNNGLSLDQANLEKATQPSR